MSLEKLSYSYLHTLSCSYQTFLRYQGRIKGPVTHYLALGNAVHWALEKLYGDEPHKVVLTLDQTLDVFDKEFKRIIDEDDVFVTYPQLKKAQANGMEMIALFFTQLEQGIVSSTPLAVEKKFELPIGSTIIVGKIDKIENDSGLTLIDYKSGSKKPDTWFLTKNLQFSAYALACKELYGQYPDKIIWHHLRTGSLIETSRSEWDIDQLRRSVDSAVKMHEEGIRFRVYNEQICNYCDYSGGFNGNGACDDQELEEKILGQA